jgi:hypothetical protein
VLPPDVDGNSRQFSNEWKYQYTLARQRRRTYRQVRIRVPDKRSKPALRHAIAGPIAPRAGT